MSREVFQDPRAPYEDEDRLTVQIHAPLPDRVKIGHFDPGGGEVVNEALGRAEYLERLQEACRKHRDKLTVRFYAYYGEDRFDASVLDVLDEVRQLAIDVYCEVANLDAVGRLPKLTRLRFSPRKKTRTDALRAMGVERLEHFTLGETATPPLDLSPLGDAPSLRTLRLLARGKNTEAIGNCTSLTELAIHPSDKFSLDFINRLEKLEVLKFVLGRVETINAVGRLPALRDLSFREVRLLEDLGDLQRFPRLRRLQVSDQKRIGELSVGPENEELEHLYLYAVPALRTIHGLAALPSLRSLYAYDSDLDLRWSELPKSMTHLQLLTKKMKGREDRATEVRAHGLTPEVHPDAQFFYK